MYADAYGPWWEVYTTCPNANKSIYSDGSKIVEALYQAASDPAEKERLAKLAIEMQDKRIRFFGNDPKYPKAYILGEKGLAYLDFYGETKLAEARECLRQSVEGMAAGSKILVLVKLVDASYALYKQDPNGKAEQFISDYELASTYLGEQASNTNNKNAEIAGKQKDYVDNIFAISGAADCSKLDEIYAAVVQQNLSNLDMLTKIAKLYKRVRCTESDVYFAACEAAHKLTHEGVLNPDCNCEEKTEKAGDGVWLFTTATCPNCKIACSLLDKAGVAYEKLLANEHADKAKAFGIKQAPTLVIVKDGQVSKYTGVSDIKKMLKA